MNITEMIESLQYLQFVVGSHAPIHVVIDGKLHDLEISSINSRVEISPIFSNNNDDLKRFAQREMQ